MALTKDDLMIGNIVYRLVVNNNAWRRDKITMVDDAGVEWYRYDKPIWSYRVIPMKICGTVKHIVRGIIENDCTFDNEYHMQHLPDSEGKADGTIGYWAEPELIEPCGDNEFFSTELDAIGRGESICVNKNRP